MDQTERERRRKLIAEIRSDKERAIAERNKAAEALDPFEIDDANRRAYAAEPEPIVRKVTEQPPPVERKPARSPDWSAWERWLRVRLDAERRFQAAVLQLSRADHAAKVSVASANR